MQKLFRRYGNITSMMFAVFSILICLADRSPIHVTQNYIEGNIQGQFMSYYDGVISQSPPGVYIFRVLVPFTVYFIASLVTFIGPVEIDFVLKAIILLLCQETLFCYCKKFHNPLISMIGVLVFDIVTCYALFYIQGPSLIETSDLLTALLFILSLIAIENDKPLFLCALLAVGTLNRETTGFIVLIFVIHELITSHRWHWVVAVIAAVAIPYFGVRLMLGPAQSWFTTAAIADNLPFFSNSDLKRVLASNVRFSMMIIPIIVLAVKGWKSGPLYLRIALACVPLFVVLHYIVRGIIETRLWIPLLPLLIPLAFFSWGEELNSQVKTDNSAV